MLLQEQLSILCLTQASQCERQPEDLNTRTQTLFCKCVLVSSIYLKIVLVSSRHFWPPWWPCCRSWRRRGFSWCSWPPSVVRRASWESVDVLLHRDVDSRSVCVERLMGFLFVNKKTFEVITLHFKVNQTKVFKSGFAKQLLLSLQNSDFQSCWCAQGLRKKT